MGEPGSGIPSRRPRRTSLARTITAAGPLVVRRRARRDLGLLVVWTALVAFSLLLAVGGPRLLLGTIDAGARQAVARAGSSNVDLTVRAAAGVLGHGSTVAVIDPTDVLKLAAALPHRLPAGLAAVYGGTTVSVLGPETGATLVDGAPTAKNIRIQLGMLTPANSKALALASGSLPPTATHPGDIDVVLSSVAAKAAGLHVGSVVRVGSFDGSASTAAAQTLDLQVVGVVNQVPTASGPSPWRDLPNMWKPSSTTPSDVVPPIGITVLAQPNDVTRAAGVYSENFVARIGLHLDPAKFTAALESRVATEIAAVTANPQLLEGGSGTNLSVHSDFATALADFPAQERAALAQMSVMVAGVLGVAAAVIILLSRLLVLRRSGEVALERARGSSLLAIAARVFLESLIASIVAAVIGLGVAAVVIPGGFEDVAVLVAVVLVALFAAPVQAVIIARLLWTGRRAPANRQDRVELEKRGRARRIALEVTVVVLAVAALYSLSNRGLLETRTDGIDPFLAAAPLLFAIVVTIVVLRVYQYPVRLAASLGRRSPGVLGLLGAVRAQRALAVLPLLALTLAVALAVGGGLLISTVETGQVTASWQRIGADVRVEAPVTEADAARVATQPGVTGASASRVSFAVQMATGTSTAFPTMIAVDHRFPDLIDRLPAGSEDGSDTAILRKLAAATPSTEPLPAVVDSELAKQLVTKDIAIYVGTRHVLVHVIGVTHVQPTGYLSGPFFYVDLASVQQRVGALANAHTLLVTGPGSAAAVSQLHPPRSAVHSRASWLADRRHLALVSGVQTTMLLATGTVALLAMIALIATVLAGARERGRSVALMRTLGMRAGLGWWLSLAELTPVVVAALAGGIVAGVGMVVWLEPSLGLDLLAGGQYIPPPSVSPILIVGLAAAAIILLGISVLAEVAAHRRDKLSEVLRVGETV